ncbi:MAG: tetratricopeptide repeat protein, partial [Planctomycetes bacterium]|nr:tetratricopeptide repeat protein [Planctomycetota bacterium]
MHAETSYLFRHAIVRNGAYSLQLPAHRQELHALAVDCFEHCFGEDDIKQYCGQLAGHARLGELPAASETHFLVQATELTSATYQNNDAASYLFRLVELHPDNAKFRMQLGMALFDIGQMAASKRELHTAIKLADVDLVAECRVALAITLTSLGDIDTARTELETLLLAATGELRLRALGNLANLLAVTGQLEQAEVAYREIIEDSGTQRMTAMAQTALANVLTELGKPEEAGQLGEAALAIARQVG